MLMSAFFNDTFQQIFEVKKEFLGNMLLLFNGTIQWQRLVTLLYCSKLYFSSIGRRIFSYLESTNSDSLK